MNKVIPEGEPLIPEDAERVFEGVLFDVYQWRQKMFDGSVSTFEGLKRADSALIIGIDESDHIILLNEEQPHKRPSIRLPGGRVDAVDASTLEAAKREMSEETGYVFKQWRLIHVNRVTSKIDWFIHYYLAYDIAEKLKPSHETGGESIQVLRLSYDEALDKLDHDDEYALLHKAGSLGGLKATPEFAGRTVDVSPKIEHIG